MNACTIDVDYDIGLDVYEADLIRAAKEHRCCECGDLIAVGEEHERVKGLWDGHWAQFRTCVICVRIRSDLFCSFVHGGMREAFWDAYGFDYVMAPAEWDEDD